MKVETYVINLDGSNDRLENATAILSSQNLRFERFPAVDGRGKSLSEFQMYDDKKTKELLGRSLMSSEIGCFLSHRGCVEKFLTTDADYLIVLEDDMQITSDFAKQLQSLLNYLDQHRELDWYLINIAPKKKKLSKDISELDGFTLWHAFYFPIRGLGLIWSRKGAEDFLKQAQQITMPVDILFQTWLSRNGKGLAVWPAFVKPAGIDSDILQTVATDKISRKEKEKRDSSYTLKKYKRMLRDKYFALSNKFNSNSKF